jgi:hypothetical protein
MNTFYVKTLKLLLVTSAFVLLSACSPSPEQVAQEYWQAVLVDDQATIQRLVKEQSTRELSHIIQPGPASTVSFEKTEVAEQQARVQTHLQWGEVDKEAHFNFDTVLARTDDGWKIEPVATRDEFFDSVYNSTLSGLEAALNQSLESFKAVSGEVAREMTMELSKASAELQRQTEQANEEIQEFLNELDRELSQELEKHSGSGP